MTLRQKILLIIGATLVALMIGLYAISSTVFLRGFAHLEKQDLQWNVRRARNAFADELATLNFKAADWSVWNDSYAFFDKGPENFAPPNIGAPAFLDLRLNLMVFVNRSGRVVFSKAFDLDRAVEAPVSAALLQSLTARSPLLHHEGVASVHSGLLLLPEGPLLIVARPILTGYRRAPIRGTLIVGRYLDAALVRGVAEETQLSLAVRRYDDAELPADFREARTALSRQTPVTIRALSGEVIAGYTVWRDIAGQPAVLLRVSLPRHIFGQGRITIEYLVSALLIVGLVFGLVTVALLEGLVLARLSRLIAAVKRIGVDGDFTGRVEVGGRDELAALAQAINRMLGALRESEEMFRSLSSSSPLGIVLTDPAGRSTYANPRTLVLLGQSLPASTAAGWTQVVHPAERAGVLADWNAYLHAGQRFAREFRIEHSQTGVRWIHLHAAPMTADDGTVRGHVATIEDITERKLAEADHARLILAVEQATETIVITDLEGRIVYANPAFERISGYSRTEAIGQNPRLLKSGKHDAEFYRALWTTLHQGEVWSGHFINKRRDGTLYQEEAVISPVRDAAGQVVNFVAVKRDVTYERQVEEQFRQAQKMDAVGRLAGGVAHDFNNILTAITGYSELLLRNLTVEDGRRNAAVQIKKAARRAADLTRQLLAFSRKQLLQPRVLDLNSVITDMEQMVRRLIGEDIELRPRLAAALGHVKADPGHLEQIIMNLAVNARDAMPDGGTFTIATANTTIGGPGAAPAGAGPAAPPELADGDYVLLSVSDTGSGMTPDVQAHIFEPFFTTKATDKGTGLGLATCYGIIKQSGGDISVETEPGRGTTFRIYLPRVAAPLASQPPPEKVAAAPRGTETILLVEDEPAVRELAVLVLTDLGYTVLAAANGLEALAVVQGRNGNPLHLLVTDVVMPQMGGKELASRLQTKHPGTKVLFTSGYTADAVLRHGIIEADIAFLQKPYTAALLARTIRQVLES